MEAIIAMVQEAPIDYLDYGISGIFALFLIGVSGWLYLWTRHVLEREKERDAHRRTWDMKMLETLEKYNDGLASMNEVFLKQASAMVALRESIMASAARDREACSQGKDEIEKQLADHESRAEGRFGKLSGDHDELRGLVREDLSGRK